MTVNRVAENVLATMGVICWSIQLIPQIWKSYRTKSTEGLSHWLLLLWAISAPFLGVYVIVQNLNAPLIIQPQIFATLVLVSWCQCLYYGKKRDKTECLIVFFVVALVMGGLQHGMVYAVKAAYENGTGNNRTLQFFGIVSPVLIAIALLPQYYEIWKHKEVIGISITFMVIDLLGGVFSDLSLAFKENFDLIAASTYTLVIVMDAVVIIAAMILNPRAKRRRKREAQLATWKPFSCCCCSHSHSQPQPPPVTYQREHKPGHPSREPNARWPSPKDKRQSYISVTSVV